MKYTSYNIYIYTTPCGNAESAERGAGWLEFLEQLKSKNKKAAAFGCYGWSGESVKILRERLAAAGLTVVDESVRSLWVPGEEDLAAIPAMVTALLAK